MSSRTRLITLQYARNLDTLPLLEIPGTNILLALDLRSTWSYSTSSSVLRVSQLELQRAYVATPYALK